MFNGLKFLIPVLLISLSSYIDAGTILSKWNGTGMVINWKSSLTNAWKSGYKYNKNNNFKKNQITSNVDNRINGHENHWMSKNISNIYNAASLEYGIPRGILYAISVHESGKNGDPWPWTLNVDGTGYYYNSRIQECDAIKTFLKNGAQFIDIGPMQMDWEYHGNMFLNVWQATNPEVNISASAFLLNKLHKETGSWHKAVAYYHSSIPGRGIPYMDAVYNIKNNNNNTKRVHDGNYFQIRYNKSIYSSNNNKLLALK
jgi:hypothetical protein